MSICSCVCSHLEDRVITIVINEICLRELVYRFVRLTMRLGRCKTLVEVRETAETHGKSGKEEEECNDCYGEMIRMGRLG